GIQCIVAVRRRSVKPSPAECREGATRDTSRRRSEGEDMRRIGDVLQLLLAEIDKLGGDCAACVTPGFGGNADSAWRRKSFEPRCEIDAVPVDVVGRDDHVAEVDADTIFDAAALRQPGVACEDGPLHFDAEPHRIDDARELDQSTIPGALDDTPVVFSYFWL